MDNDQRRRRWGWLLNINFSRGWPAVVSLIYFISNAIEVALWSFPPTTTSVLLSLKKYIRCCWWCCALQRDINYGTVDKRINHHKFFKMSPLKFMTIYIFWISRARGLWRYSRNQQPKQRRRSHWGEMEIPRGSMRMRVLWALAKQGGINIHFFVVI